MTDGLCPRPKGLLLRLLKRPPFFSVWPQHSLTSTFHSQSSRSCDFLSRLPPVCSCEPWLEVSSQSRTLGQLSFFPLFPELGHLVLIPGLMHRSPLSPCSVYMWITLPVWNSELLIGLAPCNKNSIQRESEESWTGWEEFGHESALNQSKISVAREMGACQTLWRNHS